MSLFAGMAVKLYDDLNDNLLLQKFKNETFMEFLKGVHFILITMISIQEPLFFIMAYSSIWCNYLGNSDTYSDPYEHSVLYSCFILFFLIDYTKLTDLCLLDIILILCLCTTMFIEPLFMKKYFNDCEFSFQKLIMRAILLLESIVVVLSGMCQSSALHHIILYFVGYFTVSVLVQAYSIKLIRFSSDKKVSKKWSASSVSKKKKVSTTAAPAPTTSCVKIVKLDGA